VTVVIKLEAWQMKKLWSLINPNKSTIEECNYEKNQPHKK
jgi:hypothetical protein